MHWMYDGLKDNLEWIDELNSSWLSQLYHHDGEDVDTTAEQLKIAAQAVAADVGRRVDTTDTGGDHAVDTSWCRRRCRSKTKELVIDEPFA